MPVQILEVEELDAWCGREVGVSDWLDITQERIDRFAEATEDRQWIHLDAARAAVESPYKTTIAHGFLSLAIIPALSWQAFRLEGGFRLRVTYGLNRVRFPAPVPSGARVRARFSLQDYQPAAWGVQTVWQATVEAEGQPKPCVAAEWVTRYYR